MAGVYVIESTNYDCEKCYIGFLIIIYKIKCIIEKKREVNIIYCTIIARIDSSSVC